MSGDLGFPLRHRVVPELAINSNLVTDDPRNILTSPVEGLRRWPRNGDCVIECNDGSLRDGVSVAQVDIERLTANAIWQGEISQLLMSQLLCIPGLWPNDRGMPIETAWVMGSEVNLLVAELCNLGNCNNAVGFDLERELVENPPYLRVGKQSSAISIQADVTMFGGSLPDELPMERRTPQLIWARHILPFLPGKLGTSRGPTGQSRLDSVLSWYDHLTPNGLLVIEDWHDLVLSEEWNRVTQLVQSTSAAPERNGFTGASGLRTLYKLFPGQVHWRIIERSPFCEFIQPVKQGMAEKVRARLADHQVPSTPENLLAYDYARRGGTIDDALARDRDLRYSVVQIVVKKPADVQRR